MNPQRNADICGCSAHPVFHSLPQTSPACSLPGSAYTWTCERVSVVPHQTRVCHVKRSVRTEQLLALFHKRESTGGGVGRWSL